MKPSIIRLLIWISVCAGSIAGYGFWFSVIAGESAVVAGLQNQIDTNMETAGRVAAARTTLAEIAGDESAVRNYFVQETEVVSFIDNLEARARAQTAVVKVLSVSAGNSSKRPAFILILAVSGTFDAVMRTVGATEYAPYDLSISKLSLNKEGKNKWSANLELTVGSVPAGAATSTRETAQKSISIYRP